MSSSELLIALFLLPFFFFPSIPCVLLPFCSPPAHPVPSNAVTICSQTAPNASAAFTDTVSDRVPSQRTGKMETVLLVCPYTYCSHTAHVLLTYCSRTICISLYVLSTFCSRIAQALLTYCSIPAHILLNSFSHIA